MDLKINASNNGNVQINRRAAVVSDESNEEFINVLNAFILSADQSDSLGQVTIDVPTQNELTLRCLLGSINYQRRMNQFSTAKLRKLIAYQA